MKADLVDRLGLRPARVAAGIPPRAATAGPGRGSVQWRCVAVGYQHVGADEKVDDAVQDHQRQICELFVCFSPSRVWVLLT